MEPLKSRTSVILRPLNACSRREFWNPGHSFSICPSLSCDLLHLPHMLLPRGSAICCSLEWQISSHLISDFELPKLWATSNLLSYKLAALGNFVLITQHCLMQKFSFKE
jgi:hypothetical protein